MTGPDRPRRPVGAIVLAAALLLTGALATPAALGASGDLSVTVASDGGTSVALSMVDANGSALRYAMDGNFTPLVDLLPVSASQKASYLAEVELAESSPLSSSYFGNHDGQVASGEVTLFESLVLNEATLLPSGSVVGASTVVLALNGVPATSGRLAQVAFLGATGPDASAAPITVVTTLAYDLPYGSGEQNLSFRVALPTAFAGLGTSGTVPEVNVTIVTPTATAIASVSGLTGAALSNDVWGWGSATATGRYAPLSNGTVTVLFHPSFPVGDVALGAAAAASVGAVAFLVLRRHRRRPVGRTASSDEKVGPSGSA